MPHITLLIEHVCDAHVARDPGGPLITRVDDAWAYCAGHGLEGHVWRHIPPLSRQLVESLSGAIELICRDAGHLEHGRRVEDGHGFLTVADRRWAYCSAARPDEPHDFVPVDPIALHDVRHAELSQITHQE